jgi:hypothetical protein
MEIMKTYEEIDKIIAEMPDEVFEKCLDDDFDRWDLDRRISKNGMARLTRRLAKYDLTVAEWDAWDA